MSNDRKLILFLSDHPLVPSGVGIQAKYVIEQMIGTGKYKFFCFGGAIRHPNYDLQCVAPEIYGDANWLIQPVDGHGDKERMRKALRELKPAAVVIFTDPRFFTWVFEMEDEIRAVAPIVYWHVWDNDPVPEYNRSIYDCCDFIMPLSLKTYGILQSLGFPKDRYMYVPHAQPHELFRPLPEADIIASKRQYFGPFAECEYVVFWNNRNARRKMPGDVIESFAKLAKKVGRQRVALMMHTAAGDQEGQDLHAVAQKFGVHDRLMLSEQRVNPEQMNLIYNCVDVTLNIANNEGWGLSSTESIFAGTPIVNNMTGGLQFQMGDWYEDLTDFSDQEKLLKIAKDRRGTHNWWGVPVFPATRSCVGSQQVPYIYDDRATADDVAAALAKLMAMGRTKRRELGLKAREWAVKNFNIDRLRQSWDQCLTTAIDAHAAKGRTSVRMAVI